jgi:hypothetical protein
VPPVEKPAIRTGDFVLGLGYHSVFNEDAYHQFADYVRSCGASAAWCAATYRPEEIKIAPGEIFIDAQWQFGDAEVSVPGYDIKVFPASGVVQCEVYEMIQAEMARILAEPKGK